MKTDEKKMTDAISALMELNFHQLLIMQANLSEHILNTYEYHARRVSDADHKKEPSESAH